MPAAVAESRARFWRFVADRSSLPVSLTDAVLRSAGRHADAAIWAQLKALAESALASEEKFRYYEALAQARDPGARRAQPGARARARRAAAGAPRHPARRSRPPVMAGWRGHSPRSMPTSCSPTPRATPAGGCSLAWWTRSASAATADELEAFVAARLPADALVDARRAGDEIRTRARLKARLLPQLEAALATP